MLLIHNKFRRQHRKVQNFVLRTSLKLKPYCANSVNNPKWFLMFLLSRFQIVRSNIDLFSDKVVPAQSTETSIFKDLDVKTVVQALQKDGLYLGIELPQNVIAEILAFSKREPCYANFKRAHTFTLSDRAVQQTAYGETIIVGDYFDPEKNCATIKQIVQDPKLLEIAAQYLKASPVFTGARLWWSFATNASLQERLNFAQELFHYDPIDYRSLKFFFYLSDVDNQSGAHVCVRGSHNQKHLSHQLTLLIGRSDRDIRKYYQQEDILTICGTTGYGFAEDPFCFHKGTPPHDRDRLMLQVEYCMNQYRPL